MLAREAVLFSFRSPSPFGARPRFLHSQRAFLPDPRWPGWEVVVGVEVHAQIKSKYKLFSGASTSGYGESPNSRVSLFDAALPGTLPRLNPRCVELALRSAIALNSTIQPLSKFDRKHYFYADLPAGYQITQRYKPLAKGGYLELPQSGIKVRIEQIQLEQDTGKTTMSSRRRVSSIDLNRAGMGLMEIVSKPDIRSPEEAGDYVRTLQALLRTIGSSDGNMEKGSFRCDVNVSVRRPGDPSGTRCEIKNLNSVKFAMIAIASEVYRHVSLLEAGSLVPQETRGFDEFRNETIRLRSKEDSPDYRYMPDPNIPPLMLNTDYVNGIRNRMPESPQEIRTRLIGYGLSERDVDILANVDSHRDVGVDGEPGEGVVAYLDALADRHDVKTVVNWLTNELLGQLTLRSKSFKENTISVSQMSDIILMVQKGELTGHAGKSILRYMLDSPSSKTARQLSEELSLLAIQDNSLEQICKEIVNSMPSEVQAYQRGNMNVLNKIVGSVMKASRGTADAQTTKTILKEILKETNYHKRDE